MIFYKTLNVLVHLFIENVSIYVDNMPELLSWRRQW